MRDMAKTKPDREHFGEATEFVKTIVSELVKQVSALTSRTLETFKGDIVGEQVAKFYNKLREAGIPDELAEKLTMEYAKRLLEALKPETKLVGMLLPKGLMEAGRATLITAAAADKTKVTVVKKLIESLSIPEETKRSIIAMLEEALKNGEKQQGASQ